MNFLTLPDLVLINILLYLSCEDVLDAFHVFCDRIEKLFEERRGFEQIGLALNSTHQQFTVIKNVWLYELIKSIVGDNVSPYVLILFNLQCLFHSLTNFRLISGRTCTIVNDCLRRKTEIYRDRARLPYTTRVHGVIRWETDSVYGDRTKVLSD
jgi:hypothetical protein